MLVSVKLPIPETDLEAALVKCKNAALHEFSAKLIGMEANPSVLEGELIRLEVAIKAKNHEKF